MSLKSARKRSSEARFQINNPLNYSVSTHNELENLEFIEQDFKEIQAKRRQEDQAFLASFNHDNPREEIKQKPSTELVRSPLASPIAKKYFRKASPSPSS